MPLALSREPPLRRSPAPAACWAVIIADLGRKRREELAGVDVSGAMNRLLPVLLACAACHTPTTTPAAKAPGAGEDLQMQVVRLEHTQTKDVAKALEETLASRSPSFDGLRIAVQPGHNALVLSGTTEQIREALEVVARLDARPTR
jgi:type II secretory pathway component GspD/PulD (secretin)